MCLMTKYDKGKILVRCQKSKSKHFIGYKIVKFQSDSGPVFSPFHYDPIPVGKNTLSLHPCETPYIQGWDTLPKNEGIGIRCFTYPQGFHIYARNDDAKLVLNTLLEDNKRHKISTTYKYAIVPVYFYAKHVVAEGLENFIGEKNAPLQSVLVVTEYIIKKKDYPVKIPKKQSVTR